MDRRIIALFTDFDFSDGYIGVMKGVILRISPDAKIVDLAHGLKKYDIRDAAFKLLVSYRFFPKNTIFVGVVDPGVGTKREGIVIRTKNYFFVGPNNGLFSLACNDDGVESIRILSNRRYMLPVISSTFHGRDIFAPVAAYLSKNVPIESFGDELDKSKFVQIKLREPVVKNNLYEGEVITVDRFGNVITNIPGEVFQRKEKIGNIFLLEQGSKKFTLRYVKTYGDAELGESIILTGSHGYVELSVRQGSASERFKLGPRSIVHLKRIEI